MITINFNKIRTIKVTLLSLVLLGLGILGIVVVQRSDTLPLRLPNYLPGETRRTNQEVVGFLPYWNLKNTSELDISALTTIYYFAVDINADGSFNTDDPGWGRLASPEIKNLKLRMKNSGIRWGLTIVNLDQNSIAKNINNETGRKRLIENTVQLMKDRGFQDLNIDLEYVGDPDPGLTQDFTDLVTDLTDTVHGSIPGSKVSLDAFADSVIKPRIFDMKRLGEIVDQVVIMAYDIHRLNSINAGPISPLFGKEKYEYDVTTAVKDYLGAVKSDKILLGVPFYGYEWPTENNEKGAFVIKSYRGAEISSYHRSTETAKENNASINFDDESGSVWFSYFDNKSQTWRQTWFENERSLGLKIDLMKQAKLGGMAIFALGYDGVEAGPLWQGIKEKLSQK